MIRWRQAAGDPTESVIVASYGSHVRSNLKIFFAIVLSLLPISANADPSRYESSIDIEVRDASAFLSSLDKELDLRIDNKTLADYAESIAIGNEYSLDIDIHHDGIVFTATYKIVKEKTDRVELTFTSFQKRAARAICQQMAEFSQVNGSQHSQKSCRYD